MQKDERVQVRLSAKDKRLLERAAKHARQSLSSYILAAAVSKASSIPNPGGRGI